MKSGSSSRRELSARSKHSSLQHIDRKTKITVNGVSLTRSKSGSSNNKNSSNTTTTTAVSLNHTNYCYSDGKSLIKSIENNKPSISNGMYYSHFSNKVIPVDISIKNI